MNERRCKMDNLKRQAYMAQLRKGLRRGAAAKAIGLGYHTIINAYKADPTFLQEMSEAEIVALDPIEDRLYQLAMSGDFKACIFILCNRNPERWKDARSAAVIINNTPSMSREQLLEEARKRGIA